MDAVFPRFSCAFVLYVRTYTFPSLARCGFSHVDSRRRLRRTVSCSTSHSSASQLSVFRDCHESSDFRGAKS